LRGKYANPRFNAGRFGAPADDAMSVLLKEGIGCQVAGLAASGAEEIAVNVIGGRFSGGRSIPRSELPQRSTSNQSRVIRPPETPSVCIFFLIWQVNQ
jgi:hypothetical protein